MQNVNLRRYSPLPADQVIHNFTLNCKITSLPKFEKSVEYSSNHKVLAWPPFLFLFPLNINGKLELTKGPF